MCKGLAKQDVMGYVPFEKTPPMCVKTQSKFASSPCPFDLDRSCARVSKSSVVSYEDANASVAEAVVDLYPDEKLLREIWDSVDECKGRAPTSVPEDCDSDEECFAPKKCTEAVMGRLPCGDIHICKKGKTCPFLEPNEDRVMVCIYTGVEHGPEQTDEFFDLNGGSGKKSGDPDQNCGDMLHGKWTKRADPAQASKLAFQYSTKISDDHVFSFVTDPSSARIVKGSVKRGALCVGEIDHTHASNKKPRFLKKKKVDNHEVASHLHTEAALVITKMIDHKKTASFRSKAPSEKVERGRASTDANLCDQNAVFQMSLKQYLKNCMDNSISPSIDAIHNLSLVAQQASQCARDEQNTNKDTDSIRTAKFRNLCSSLVVSLWSAACKSPYMANAKRGTDAYRPFVCGVLYGFKRGIKLENGDVLVPQCPQLAQSLPVLRGTGGNALVKTLHSSSHRGLCTLSRCIASVPKDKQHDLFREVTRIATKFSKQTFNKNDV